MYQDYDDDDDVQVSAEQRSAYWKALEDAVTSRSRNVEQAGEALLQAKWDIS